MRSSRVFMVRPNHFGFNSQTAESNSFQKNVLKHESLSKEAVDEFEELVTLLQKEGVHVHIRDQKMHPPTPDAVFPNNWVSFHKEQSKVFMYPMEAPNRRDERCEDWIHELIAEWPNYTLEDWTHFEKENQYLEGTGSLVLDPLSNKVYASISSRTSLSLAEKWSKSMDMELLSFQATDKTNTAIYHTNVVMGIGKLLAMGCWDSIKNVQEHRRIITSLNRANRPVISLTADQMNHFAGNWIELYGTSGPLFLCSKTAWNTLKEEQKSVIEGLYKPVIADIDSIEKTGGGSVRCMICTVEV